MESKFFTTMDKKRTLIHNTAEKRYEFDIDGDKAIVEYSLQPGVMILSHTYVPQKHEGKGIGSELIRAVLEDIKEQGLQIVPQCQFIAQYIYRHPEWEELVLKEVVK